MIVKRYKKWNLKEIKQINVKEIAMTVLFDT